jgi:hypothetical protein
MKTLVLGASPNPDRYSYKAILMLQKYKHEVIALGKKTGAIANVTIIQQKINLTSVHTIALYLSPENQKEYYSYILSLKPKRVIFNPGTENNELSALLKLKGIPYIEGCVLVMLSSNQYE